MKKFILITCVALLAQSSFSETQKPAGQTPPKSFKVLAIGNSFSQDAMRHLYQIATNAGVQDVVLGNMYIAGCSLATHRVNAQTDSKTYIYEKNTNGIWDRKRNRTLEFGIQDEEWDVITLQQVSHCSGQPETYNSDLDHLIAYVNDRKTNPDAKLAWHMTWAYQADSTHREFSKYGKDQMRMYNAIVSAVTEKIAGNPAFDIIIPSGTAIQNMRTSYIGDTLTRDGFHMSYNLGRYITGMTWLKALTGIPLDTVSWVPDETEVPASRLPVIQEAVNNAVKTPFAVTGSGYKNDPGTDN